MPFHGRSIQTYHIDTASTGIGQLHEMRLSILYAFVGFVHMVDDLGAGFRPTNLLDF